MSRTEAVEAMYQDMAARHRARFRSIHVRHTTQRSRTPRVTAERNGTDSCTLDPPRRRAREVRRCQAPLHQAAAHQEPGLPPAPPRPQDQHQEGLLRPPPIDFRLSAWFLWWLEWLMSTWRIGTLVMTAGATDGTLEQEKKETNVGPDGGFSRVVFIRDHGVSLAFALHGS